VMAQIAYYFVAGVALGAPDVKLAFAVPTGNFGNVFAGWAAGRMGLPIERLVVGSNRNDILTRFFDTGVMTTEGVVPTLSPSMDIQVSSNFERLLWESLDRDGQAVDRLMGEFRAGGRMALPEAAWRRMRLLFEAYRFDDPATLELMRTLYRDTGELIDPHSAVGIGAGRTAVLAPEVRLVALATAHPAKFPDAVERATGTRPALPGPLADLLTRPERLDVVANDVEAVKTAVRGFAARKRP